MSALPGASDTALRGASDAHPHQRVARRPEAPELPTQADMVDTMVELAKSAVRSAVTAGGDPAAGVLRLLLNELSPMPEPAGPVGADADLHLRAVSGAMVLRAKARAQRTKPSADQFKALAAVLDDVAALTKGDEA